MGQHDLGNSLLPALGRGGWWADTGRRPQEGEEAQVALMGVLALFVLRLPSSLLLVTAALFFPRPPHAVPHTVNGRTTLSGHGKTHMI